MPRVDSSGLRSRETRFVFGIIALHLCVAIPLALYLNIWIDEAYSLRTTSRDLAFAIHNSRHFEQQPPIYFVQLWAWRVINSSIPFARLNSILLVALALWVTYLAARRWFDGVSPLWALAALAVNTYTLYAASELRPYCMILLLSALLLLLFYDGFYAEAPRRLAQVAYAGTALVSLFTYYYLGCILVACAAVLLAERRWRTLFLYCAWMIGVGTLFVPGFLATTGHIHAVAHAIGSPPTLFRTLNFVLGRIFAMPFALPLLASPVRWATGLTVMAIVFGFAWAVRGRITPKVRALWIIVAVIGGFYFLVVQLVMGESVFPRHSLVMLVPTLFAMFALFGLAGRGQTRTLAMWLVAMAAFNAAGCVYQFGDLAKLGDFRRVARYIESKEKPGQSIAIIASHAELPLGAYYRGTSRVVPLPARDDFSGYTLEKWRLESPEQVRQALSGAASEEGLLWVFTDRPPDSVFLGLDLNFEFLEEVLAEDYTLVEEVNFYHGKLRLFSKRSVALASATPKN